MIRRDPSHLARRFLPLLVLLPLLGGLSYVWVCYGQLLHDLVNAAMKLGVLP